MHRYLTNFLTIITTVVLFTVVPLLFIFENTTSLVWTIIIPLIPIILLSIGYSNWRNICPLAFVSKLSQNITWFKKRKVPRWFEDNFYYFQFFLLFSAFSARLIFLNYSSFSLAIFFIFVMLMAFVINLIFTGKSWCNFFCPVSVVEKIYSSSNAHNYTLNSACSTCSACKKHCPDTDLESSYWKESANNQKTFVFYSFSGLILGFYLYFYLQSGSFSYYFTGTWTQTPLSLWSDGFFFAPVIPLIIAAPLSLAIFTLASFYLFKFIENFVWKRVRKPSLSFNTFTHRVKAVASFVAFNIFYIFAGAPSYQHFPLMYGIFHFIVIAISAIILHKEFFREENFFIQERFALNMIKRWRFNEPIPTNLKEIYYTYVNKKKNKVEQLEMYKDSLSELMDEGILTQESMVVLEKLREQMGISTKDHLDTIKTIQRKDKDLFDMNIEKSSERRHQRKHYKKMLTEILKNPAGINNSTIHALQEQCQISDKNHKEIMLEIMHSDASHEENVINIIKEMTFISSSHASYTDDNSLETNFLKFALRNYFNTLSQKLFTILNIIYEENKEDLLPFSKIFIYDRGDLLLECKPQILGFMDKDIIDAIQNLLHSTQTVNASINHLGLLQQITKNDSLELSTIALLCLDKFDSSLYSEISLEKFISCGDLDIINVVNNLTLHTHKITLYHKMMFLHSINFFTNISLTKLNHLAQDTFLTFFDARQEIIKQGDKGDSLFMLIEGEVEVLINDKIVAKLSKGDYFGEISIIADVARTATIKCINKCTTLQLLSNDFKNFLLESPHTSVELIREITLRLLENKK